MPSNEKKVIKTLHCLLANERVKILNESIANKLKKYHIIKSLQNITLCSS